MALPLVKPHWEPASRPVTKNVSLRLLLSGASLVVANLKCTHVATVDEHAASFQIEMLCISRGGFVSVGQQAHAIREGERVKFPPDVKHRTWAEDEEMETLMIERRGKSDGSNVPAFGV
jgi:quercetin dioxygenase-like cupin family protein